MDTIFAGIGAAIVASLLTALFTFHFQKKLLKQQLEFQKSLLDQQLADGKNAQEEFIKFLEKVSHGMAQSGATLRTQIYHAAQDVCAVIVKGQQSK